MFHKLLMVGVLSIAGVLSVTTDAQAFGKRKKGNNCDCAPPPCNTCGYGGGYGGYAAAPCDSCGSGGYAGAMTMPAGGIPAAMPNPTTGSVTPASGTTVLPAGGTVTGGTTVVPAGGYYYDSGTGRYYQNGYYGGTQQGFVPGVIEGASGQSGWTGNTWYGTPSYVTPSTYAGRRLGGLFRR
jgi:hypothetical protein